MNKGWNCTGKASRQILHCSYKCEYLAGWAAPAAGFQGSSGSRRRPCPAAGWRREIKSTEHAVSTAARRQAGAAPHQSRTGGRPSRQMREHRGHRRKDNNIGQMFIGKENRERGQGYTQEKLEKPPPIPPAKNPGRFPPGVSRRRKIRESKPLRAVRVSLPDTQAPQILIPGIRAKTQRADFVHVD